MAKIHDLVQAACKTSNLGDLKAYAIDKKALTAVDLQNRTALIIAAKYGAIDVIKLLDDKSEELLGYNVYKIFRARDNSGCNALSTAAKNGHTDAVVTLYELGAYDNFNANENDWIIYAAMNIKTADDPDGIAKSLKVDAINRLDAIYKKNLYDTVTNPHSKINDIKKAISCVADINTPVYDERSALYHAVRVGNVLPVKVLLEEGARVVPEMLPLAFDSKNEEVISLLGQYIPLTAKAINWGYLLDILLDHAIRNNDARVAIRLLPNLNMVKLQEALIYSADVGSDDVLKCLLDHGVDVDAVEDSYRTRSGAMLAAKNGHLSALKLLIDKGANLHLRSEHGIGLTALEYAKIYRRKNCIQLLLETLALQKYGNSVLNRAAAHGSIKEFMAAPIDETSLEVAINVAKETKQPASFIKQIKKFLGKSPASILPLRNFFSLRK